MYEERRRVKTGISRRMEDDEVLDKVQDARGSREENRTHGRSGRSGSSRKPRLARAIFHNEKESHSGKI